MTRIRTKALVLVAALATVLGLTLAVGSSTPAKAICIDCTPIYTRGHVSTLDNVSGINLGIYYSNPPGVGCDCAGPWYPIGNGITTWTEPSSVNIGNGYLCLISFYGDPNDFSVWNHYAGVTVYKEPIPDQGLTVHSCTWEGDY